jgi:hypothetical protein
MRRFAAAVLAVGCLSIALGGCSVFRKKEARSCPTAGVVAELRRHQVYRDGPGRDLTDLRFTAGFGDVRGDCGYDRDNLDVELTVPVVAERGPALDVNSVDIEYFVAVTGPDRRILNKQPFHVRLDFSGGKNRANAIDELVIDRIKLPKGVDGGAYAIEVGFQLTPQEVEENRRRGG